MKWARLITILFVMAGCSVNKSSKTIHPYLGNSIGCGDFIVYKLEEDNTGFVSIAFNAKSVDLQRFQAYGVGKTDILEIKKKKYKGSISASICNDVMTEKPELVLEESPRQGVVEILIAEDQIEKAKNNEGYKVTIVLKKVLFEKSAIDYLRIEDVYVGWLPG